MVKKISELLKDSPLPNEAKTVGIMGAAMGANPDSIIKSMIAVTDRIETSKAESTNPKQKKIPNYTPTEKRIVEMLTENTGVNMLDSGGAYGRAWQRNRQIEDFRKQPNPIVEIYAPYKYKSENDGKMHKMGAEISVSYDLFHYLTNFLELTDKGTLSAKNIQIKFEKYAEKPENQNVGWLALMEEFMEKLHEKHEDSELLGTTNTYNYDNILNGTLQYRLIDIQDKRFILLQIHGGCDVRGGYTKPQFFEVVGYDPHNMFCAQSDLRSSCKCGKLNAYSDDCGYHWYFTNKKGYEKEHSLINRLKFVKNPDPKAYGKDKAFCKKCGSPIEFSVSEE